MSGLPVQLENIEKYAEEHRVLYDKVMVRFGIDPENPRAMTEEESKRTSWILNRVDIRLKKKYPVTEMWDEIQTEEQWLPVLEKYGAVVCTHAEGRLQYIILDINI